jgi:hypothetical protein
MSRDGQTDRCDDVTGYELLLGGGGGSYKSSTALRPFCDLICVPICVLVIPDSLYLQQSEAGSFREMSLNLADEIFLSYSVGIFKSLKS